VGAIDGVSYEMAKRKDPGYLGEVNEFKVASSPSW
jgi:hypothetical protein